MAANHAPLPLALGTPGDNKNHSKPEKPARLIMRLSFGFVSDSETNSETAMLSKQTKILQKLHVTNFPAWNFQGS